MSIVNTDTQYVVDITTGTHDIAPTLRHENKIAAICEVTRESARAVEILAWKPDLPHIYLALAALAALDGASSSERTGEC